MVVQYAPSTVCQLELPFSSFYKTSQQQEQEQQQLEQEQEQQLLNL